MQAIGYELEQREDGYAILRDPEAAIPSCSCRRPPSPSPARTACTWTSPSPTSQQPWSACSPSAPAGLWRMDFTTHHWTVLADPEGNEFCIGKFSENDPGI